MTRYAVIVDPLSTGQEYPGAFRDAGLTPIAVLSTPELAEGYRGTWHPENFARVHVFDGDLPDLAARLRAYRPECVIPGSEIGVELCDALVELVCPGTGNTPDRARARRDKWWMARALDTHGVPHLRQFCSDDRDVLDRWVRDNGLTGEPLVVKPPKSGATDNVHLVLPDQDWHPFFAQILGKMNAAGQRNEAVLVQEYAEGTEYLVDTYSVDGRHGLVDVCRYTKSRREDRIGIYDRVEFLAPDHPDIAAIWPYTRKVLDAVGIRNGCGHTEVMLTKHGPRLMETAARPAGGGHQMITQLATGDNHIQRTIAHRVHGEFRAGYTLVRHLSAVFLSAPRAGIWRNAEIFSDVDELPTFHSKHFPFGTGDRVPATDDLLTYLAWVILAGPDPDAIDADFRRLKAMESQIQITPEGVPA
jgi:biotin carboxylase